MLVPAEMGAAAFEGQPRNTENRELLEPVCTVIVELKKITYEPPGGSTRAIANASVRHLQCETHRVASARPLDA